MNQEQLSVEQLDDNLNKNYQTLSKILQTFLSSDTNAIPEKILTFMEQTNTPVNATLLDTHLVSILSIQDISIQIRALSAISLINPNVSNSLPFLPGYFQLCFKQNELVIPALKCLLNVLTINIYKKVSTQVEMIAIKGTDVARKLCLHIFHRLYLLDSIYIYDLIKYIKRALFDTACKSNAITILSEIIDSYPELINPFVGFLINELKYCDYVIFTKLTKILVKFASKDEYKPQIEKSCIEILEENRKIHFAIEISKIAVAMSNVNLIRIVASKIDLAIQITKNPDLALEMAKTFHLFNDVYTISKSSLLLLLQSQDYNIISQAMPMQSQLSVSNDNNIKIVNDMIIEISETASPHLAEVALQLVPHHGNWFVTILFELYNMKRKTLYKVISKTILDITDVKTQKDIIAEARKQLDTIPDDPFGIALAELISRTSEDPEDFFVLLPSNINYKTPEFQASMVTFVFEFWNRLNFEVDTSMMNRLLLISFSSDREVRQRALELITIMKSK